uniref:BMA-ANGL-1 n=2 Tax=Brugia malayi TaxID=6279 RepID=A0A0H5RZ48_BRUMA|nr:BMA-ANGL-1 [Brugia malayi]
MKIVVGLMLQFKKCGLETLVGYRWLLFWSILKTIRMFGEEEMKRYCKKMKISSVMNSKRYSIVRSRKSTSQSPQVFQNHKSTFNVFQLLVPKEKIEIVVDDTSVEVNCDTDVQKLNGDKANETQDAIDSDVILLTDEEESLSGSQRNLSDVKPEIVLLNESSSSDLGISDEIICLEDMNLVHEAGLSPPTLPQKTMKEQQDETGRSTICEIYREKQTGSYLTNNQSFPWAHSLLPSTSSYRPTNMPEFVDLLTQGTLSICKKWLRRWDVVQSGVIDGNPLRICSYNVLCQQTAYKTPELYIHLAKPGRAYELTWENRWRLLTREFSMIAADIFCLQEVQYDHYDYFFKPYFEAAGLLGKYKKRTHSLIDGCAIFYKSHFQLLNYQHIEYYVSSDSVLDRDNIGQLVRLKDMRSGREFCIANTHLLFNKRRGDVKLAQLAVLLANIDKECGPESGQECPYIVCGDFNIQPYSPLYNFIMSGEICFTNLRRGDISGQGSPGGPFVSVNLLPEDVKIARNCRFKYLKNRAMLLPSINCWSHPLSFNSVYHHVNTEGGPVVSTYHSVEAVNPDFIFYSVKSNGMKQAMFPSFNQEINVSEREIRLIRRLSLPNMNQLAGTLGPWPNSSTPSDHIPLIADFVLQ